MKLSLSKRILKHLRDNGIWTNGGKLEKLAQENGYKACSGDRVARKLEEDGFLLKDTKRDASGSVWYRAKDPQQVTVYKVEGKEVARVNEW